MHWRDAEPVLQVDPGPWSDIQAPEEVGLQHSGKPAVRYGSPQPPPRPPHSTAHTQQCSHYLAGRHRPEGLRPTASGSCAPHSHHPAGRLRQREDSHLEAARSAAVSASCEEEAAHSADRLLFIHRLMFPHAPSAPLSSHPHALMVLSTTHPHHGMGHTVHSPVSAEPQQYVPSALQQ